MQLLKVVSTRDEVTVGVPKDQAKGGEVIAQALAKNGYVKVWQYAPARAHDGGTVQKPVREVVLMNSQVIRIESVEVEQSVLPLPR